MKILVAIPVYDGKLHCEVVRSLLNEQAAAMVAGDELSVRFLPACSHPAVGRNQLVDDFLRSDCDRLFFLDADVTFQLGSIVKLARSSADFVGGCYRFKLQEEKYPIGWLPDPDLKGLWSNEEGLLEVASLPGGFLSLSRKVFETLSAAHPDRWYEHFGRRAHAFFQMPFTEGFMYGEDSFFCKEWRDAGGKVFLDPSLSLTHWDFNVPYPGNIGRWLINRAESKGNQ